MWFYRKMPDKRFSLKWVPNTKKHNFNSLEDYIDLNCKFIEHFEFEALHHDPTFVLWVQLLRDPCGLKNTFWQARFLLNDMRQL